MKICIVGNCQGAQLGRLIASVSADISVFDVPANYAAKEPDRQYFDDAYRKSDIIFVQHVGPNFQPEFCRADYARQFGKPVLVWPVVYFDGYFPDIGYFRAAGQTVMSILGGYHSRFIRHSYIQGRSCEDTFRDYIGDSFANTFKDSFLRSIELLRIREAACDVVISDYIDEHCRDRQMFYVTNHPDNLTLSVLLNRLLDKAGAHSVIPREIIELDQVIFPANQILLEGEGARFRTTQYFRLKSNSGMQLDPMPIQRFVEGLYRTYSMMPKEVIKAGETL